MQEKHAPKSPMSVEAEVFKVLARAMWKYNKRFIFQDQMMKRGAEHINTNG